MGNIINKEIEVNEKEPKNVHMCEWLQHGKIKVISCFQKKGQKYRIKFFVS